MAKYLNEFLIKQLMRVDGISFSPAFIHNFLVLYDLQQKKRKASGRRKRHKKVVVHDEVVSHSRTPFSELRGAAKRQKPLRTECF